MGLLKKLFGKKESKEENVKKGSEEFLEDRKKIDSNIQELREKYDMCKDTVSVDEFSDYESEMNQRKVEKEINRNQQGKVKHIISCVFGQVNQRIKKSEYDNGDGLSDQRWESYKRKIIHRYNHLTEYVVKNMSVLIAGGICVAHGLIPMLPALVVAVPYFVNVVYKAGDLYYNKKRFGKPNLTQEVTVYQGNYFENIKNAIYAYKEAKKLNKIVNNGENIKLINEGYTTNEPVNTSDETVTISEELDLNEEVANVQNDLPVRLGICIPLASDESKKYSEAVSIVRKSKDVNDRFLAYGKLAMTYGNRKKKNKTNENAKLSSYSRTLKLLSEYGHKLKDGVATKEEQEFYLSLLYYLGKDFNEEDVMDYLSDLYDSEQEKKKVLVK